MVVYENESSVSTSHAKGKVNQVAKQEIIVDSSRDFRNVSILGDQSYLKIPRKRICFIFISLVFWYSTCIVVFVYFNNSFILAIDHLVDKEFRARSESLTRWQITKSTQNVANILFDGIIKIALAKCGIKIRVIV